MYMPHQLTWCNSQRQLEMVSYHRVYVVKKGT